MSILTTKIIPTTKLRVRFTVAQNRDVRCLPAVKFYDSIGSQAYVKSTLFLILCKEQPQPKQMCNDSNDLNLIGKLNIGQLNKQKQSISTLYEIDLQKVLLSCSSRSQIPCHKVTDHPHLWRTVLL